MPKPLLLLLLLALLKKKFYSRIVTRESRINDVTLNYMLQKIRIRAL